MSRYADRAMDFADATLVHLANRESLSAILTDRKSTRLNSSHGYISYAVFCSKKKRKMLIESVTRTSSITSDGEITDEYAPPTSAHMLVAAMQSIATRSS